MNGSWSDLEQHISRVTHQKITFIEGELVSGGCINRCWKITDSNQKQWFIKTHSPALVEMFISESEGLGEIANSRSIRSPKSICSGTNQEFSYLVLEYIPLKALSNSVMLGKQLAKMHSASSESFGWHRNNTIGSTPQSNKKHNNWASFWKTERLLFQLNLALKNGYSPKAYEDGLKLAENIPHFFASYHVKPSLLHGDLWGGNAASDPEGSPVIFDPALYYGDRETDIAMTELFGGFNSGFYESYNHSYPLDQDYKTRKNLYNLYHILNHFNLFGESYASQATNMTQELLSYT